MTKTFRQILIEKYPDRRNEILAFEFPDLDLIKADNYYSMIFSCLRYYQKKLNDCEQMYRDDMGV